MSTADVVVVGGGTVGGWCAWFLARAGLRVTLVERGVLGIGASSRAAGMVRGQGGTPAAVVLGAWTREFYRSQAETVGIDSGFVEQGYYLPAFTPAQVAEARARMAMQQRLGLDVEWLDGETAAARNPTLAPGSTLGGTFAAADGYLDPPRNVVAYAVALAREGVDVRERTAFAGIRRSPSRRVVGVDTSAGPIDAGHVVLTGGPTLAAVGEAAGVRIPAGGVPHQVAVTEPHPGLDRARLPMVFDVAGGIYWRPEQDGGLLFGMSDPDAAPGPAGALDEPYLAGVRKRLAELVPVTGGLGLRRSWCATIDYTPDHLPILGPVPGLEDVSVASAGGHGMMWGPAVSRVAADVALHGRTTLFDGMPADLAVTLDDLGLDRFDGSGRSRLAPDPIALPFPSRT